MTYRQFKWLLIGVLALCMTCIGATIAIAQTSQGNGSFTLSTSVNDDGTLTPTLTWTTEPAASACSASGDAEWEGIKEASGTQVLSPRSTSEPRAFALVCQWPDDTQAFLTWTPPTENTDGTPLTNLEGYRVYWGTAQDNLDNIAQVDDPSATSYTVTELAPATWFFGVRAFTTQGAESAMSNTVSKTTRQGVEWSQQIGIKVPKAPVMGAQQ